MQKRWVISLGGSRIAPQNEEINYKFIIEFKKLTEKHLSHKFVVVTGGGSTARKYIHALKNLKKNTKTQSLAGISITRLHAGLLARIFGRRANESSPIPKSMRKVKALLNKNQVVFCGALRYQEKNTSDGTSAQLATYLRCPFINITNVQGLYTKNPLTNKNAKFIKKISWKNFLKIASKIKYRAGQHFVLDQSAAREIMKHKTPTYIVGSLKELDRILQGKNFKGTLISD